MSTTHTRTRLGAGALVLAGVLFVLYPAVRPWEDESTLDGATAAMSSAAWVASHLFAMIGFILLPLGLLALRGVLSRTAAEPVALAALVTAWIGVGLTLPYYGAEDFGLNAVATKVADGQAIDLLDVADAVRYGPVAVTTFGVGLVALGVGAVLAAVAVWRSGMLPRWSGVPFAVGLALFLPQFFTPSGVRIAHGVLVAVGSIWLALALWNVKRSEAATSPP